jgi:hypothetical protein
VGVLSAESAGQVGLNRVASFVFSLSFLKNRCTRIYIYLNIAKNIINTKLIFSQIKYLIKIFRQISIISINWTSQKNKLNKNKIP